MPTPTSPTTLDAHAREEPAHGGQGGGEQRQRTQPEPLRPSHACSVPLRPRRLPAAPGANIIGKFCIPEDVG